MSDDNFTHALYFEEGFDFDSLGVAPVDAKTVAISNLSIILGNGHLGAADFKICGDANTPSNKPVFVGNFLTSEILKANQFGFKAEEIRRFYDIALPPEEYAYDTPEKAQKLDYLKRYFESAALYDQVKGFINQRIFAEIFPDIVVADTATPVRSAREIFEQDVEMCQEPRLIQSVRDALEFDLAKHDRALSENPELLANIPSLLRYYNIVTAKLTPTEVEDIKVIGFVVKHQVDTHAFISSITNDGPSL